MVYIAGDPFFLITLAGTLLGAVGAVSTRRFARRKRPLAFRRRRRVLIPVVLVLVTVLLGRAAFIGLPRLLLWWEWSLGYLLVSALVVWIALGVPGGVPVLPVRILLLLLPVLIPASGLLFPGSTDAPTDRSIQKILDLEVSAPPPEVRVLPWGSSGGAPDDDQRLALGGSDELHLSVDVQVNSAPVWWLPEGGVPIAAVLTRKPVAENTAVRDAEALASASHTERVDFMRTAAFPNLYRVVAQVLYDLRLLDLKHVDITIPQRPGWFLQPGRYAVYWESSPDPAHPGALFYRYTQQ